MSETDKAQFGRLLFSKNEKKMSNRHKKKLIWKGIKTELFGASTLQFEISKTPIILCNKLKTMCFSYLLHSAS